MVSFQIVTICTVFSIDVTALNLKIMPKFMVYYEIRHFSTQNCILATNLLLKRATKI